MSHDRDWNDDLREPKPKRKYPASLTIVDEDELDTLLIAVETSREAHIKTIMETESVSEAELAAGEVVLLRIFENRLKGIRDK